MSQPPLANFCAWARRTPPRHWPRRPEESGSRLPGRRAWRTPSRSSAPSSTRSTYSALRRRTRRRATTISKWASPAPAVSISAPAPATGPRQIRGTTENGGARFSLPAGRRPALFPASPYSQANPHHPPADLAARAVQHFPRQRPLDLLEEFVLFPPDMAREQRAKLLQQRPSWRSAQLRNLTLHRAVFRHQERDQGYRAACRKQHLLLDLEMIDEFQFIPVRRAPRQLRHVPWRGVRGQGSPRYYAQGESVMVLVREGNQTGIAQHRLLPCYYTAPAIAR